MSTQTSDTSVNTGTGSIEAAAAAFSRILEPSRPPKREQEPPKQEAEADEAEALVAEQEGNETLDEPDTDEDADPDADTGEDDGEGDDESPDDEADDQDEDPEEAGPGPDTLVTVKIDGKEERIKLSEALAGYQRQSDYSRKTAEVAEQRKALNTEAAAVREERAQYAQLLTVLSERLTTAAPKAPDPSLRTEDPVEFAAQWAVYQEHREQAEAVRQEQARLAETARQEQVAAFATMVQQERQKMLDAVPAWKDEAIFKRDRTAMREYGVKLGFSEEELSQASDSRAVVALYKAMRFDRLVAKRAAGKPATLAGPVPKPLKPGSSNKPPARDTERSQAMKRLSKSGSVSDAAAVMATLL